MQFFLGIDGGGTRTRAFVVDAAGQRAGWGEGGLGNPNQATEETLETNFRTAINQACHRAGIQLAECVSVFAGLAGITTEAGRTQGMRLLARCGLEHAQAAVDHDIRIALAGGLGGRPGIALIVGPGSSCYGRTADGRTWQTGGWHALISDEGSGYYLGLESIIASARMADGRSPESPLRRKVFEWLGLAHVSEILLPTRERGLSRAEIASFAPEVIGLASEGDAMALSILDRGAELLAEMVEANHRRLPTGPGPDVVITGGLGTAPTIYREKIVAAIHRMLPSARVHEPLLPPAIGAVLLAMDLASQPAPPELVSQLKQHA